MKRLGWLFLGLFYVVAGVNHFWDPDFYLSLIPPYFPYPSSINIMSGVAEILLGMMVLYAPTRNIAAWLIILLLLAFIPSHIYFIQENSCVGEFCLPGWIGWLRLVVIHPLLILWAWKYTRKITPNRNKETPSSI